MDITPASQSGELWFKSRPLRTANLAQIFRGFIQSLTQMTEKYIKIGQDHFHPRPST